MFFMNLGKISQNLRFSIGTMDTTSVMKMSTNWEKNHFQIENRNSERNTRESDMKIPSYTLTTKKMGLVI